MKLQFVRICGFQSFGAEPVTVDLSDLTFLIGPNGSGKTATLQALCRLFSFDPNQRRLRKSDFSVPHDETEIPDDRVLWIEAEFTFPELSDDENEHATIPTHFGHMRLDVPDGVPRVRYRLDASIGIDDEIEQSLVYVLEVDEDEDPIETSPVPRDERNFIQVHYLPARRDPADHIAYGANALLGRLLQAARIAGEMWWRPSGESGVWGVNHGSGRYSFDYANPQNLLTNAVTKIASFFPEDKFVEEILPER